MGSEKMTRSKDAEGEHVPAFLIASITSSCNLHCAACYSRANHACSDSAPVSQLTDSGNKSNDITDSKFQITY